MKYFGYMPNDFINGEGVCVSLWTAGCPFHCVGCHNEEMWEENNGVDVPTDLKGQLIKAICANGIKRNFSVLGGEPLSPYNKHFTMEIVKSIRIAFPSIKIFLWTGYTFEELKFAIANGDEDIKEILHTVDTLVEGRYIQEKRDITLPLRGSLNQRVLHRNIDFD